MTNNTGWSRHAGINADAYSILMTVAADKENRADAIEKALEIAEEEGRDRRHPDKQFLTDDQQKTLSCRADFLRANARTLRRDAVKIRDWRAPPAEAPVG